MKSGILARLVPFFMKKPIFSYLDSIARNVSPASVADEYRAILERQPEIGGRKNNLILGLYCAAYFIAVYRIAPEKTGGDVFHGMVEAVCTSELFVKMNKGRNFFSEKNMKTRDRLQHDPEFNSYPENWRYSFSYDLSVPECTITYTRCAICEMARREGCFHLMNDLCMTDFAQQKLMGNTLIRTKTIGGGNDVCDFHIIGSGGVPHTATAPI